MRKSAALALVLAPIALVVVLTLPTAAAGKSTVEVKNLSGTATTVYVAFGADSTVKAADWKTFCAASAALNCSFQLGPTGTQVLPLAGKYLNATISFGGPVTCSTTKAELNVNNPKWYDILDVSLVDGYSNPVSIRVTYKLPTGDATTVLGPPKGASGNEKVLGVFPLGCDICTCRQSPPCGMKPGCDGCKAGTQYKPDVPCQYQGQIKGGGEAIEVVLE